MNKKDSADSKSVNTIKRFKIPRVSKWIKDSSCVKYQVREKIQNG